MYMNMYIHMKMYTGSVLPHYHINVIVYNFCMQRCKWITINLYEITCRPNEYSKKTIRFFCVTDSSAYNSDVKCFEREMESIEQVEHAPPPLLLTPTPPPHIHTHKGFN